MIDRGPTMSLQSRRRSKRTRCAKTMCSRTVNPVKSSGCWKVLAIPRRARFWGLVLVTSRPLSITDPPSGRVKPERQPNSVDFPAPLGPTNPTMLRLGTSMLTSFSATSPPNRLVMLRPTKTWSSALTWPLPAETSTRVLSCHFVFSLASIRSGGIFRRSVQQFLVGTSPRRLRQDQTR